MTEEPKKINKKKTDCSLQSDGSKLTTNVLLLYSILTRKERYMEKIDKYLEEIEAAMCKMDPIEQDRLMEVIRISFPEYFDGNYMKS